MWTNSEYIAGAGEFGIKRGKKKKKTLVSHLFGSTEFADFYFI